MSSQEKGTPLYSIPNRAGYRLIELPPELQTLLESDSPPALTLESTDTVGLLKAADKTYALRQKNTSNALILLRPHVDDPSSPSQGLAAVSTVHETVELDAVKEDAAPQPQPGKVPAPAKGKWHERFGRGR